MRDIPASDAKVYYSDAKTRGLKLAVYPSGTKSFLLYRRICGRPERIFIGQWPGITVEQARKIAERMNGQIAEGKNPAEERRQHRLEGTFGNLFERYLELHARPHKQPRSAAEDQANYRRYLSVWANRQLSSISRHDVARLHAELREKHGVYAANRVLALLSTMFNKAIEWGWSGENPCKSIKKFREESRERFLTESEMPRFLKALAEEPNRDFRDFILLGLLTGARRSNLLAMRWDEIDFAAATWRIPRTKGNKPQTVPLVGPALKILQARRESAASEWVFPSPEIPGQHVYEFRKPWERLLERAGIEGLRLHDVRRSLGSWMTKAGVALPVVKAALGHADIQTTAIYARGEEASVRQAMEVAATRMLEARHAE
ncbi:MAG TPA: tyrosine-type recombinase/integrase [Bryobacteraceae bacterium]|nr:tyrosine-type recombinase/integrase [Bryobacteraceae bacterium]